MDVILIFEGDTAELLQTRHDQGRVAWPVTRRASIKDVVESLGLPHTEVHSLLVQGQEVGFNHILEPGQEVRVRGPIRPVDLSQPSLLRPGLPSAASPGRDFAPGFLVDENVAKLAMLLRLLGHDAAYDRTWEDSLIAETAQAQGRVVLTRDKALLKRARITHGRLIRSALPRDQLLEVAGLYGLAPLGAPFTRCLRCNTLLEPVDKAAVLHRLEPRTKKYYTEFFRCPGCDRIYWPGSHHGFMAGFLEELKLG